MFKKYFKKFDFREFIDFIYDLVDKYGMYEIRFYPEHRELFSEIQLTHIAPLRSVKNQNGFAWAWKQKQDDVRRVSFDLFSQNENYKITMTIDLDKKIISLDKINGISTIQVEEALINNFTISNNWLKRLLNLVKKYLVKIAIGVIVAVVGGIILKFIL